MIKIVKADKDGNITLTEDELNQLLREAYNVGYDKGYYPITGTYKVVPTNIQESTLLDENGTPQY